jgi:membrane-associated phospholipid phosphatase
MKSADRSDADPGNVATKAERLWRRATLWLILLSVLFYLTYGLSNWLASQRGDVGAIVFAWEHAVPFVSWTIIPYWSVHVLFALSFYLSRSLSELDNHAKRLLTAQVVAVCCFIVFPLRVSFARPHVEGALASLFEPLRLLDQPFNEAPSLHVATMTILYDLYARILPRWAQLPFAVWAVIVVGSVMTTYQHHFIDIPTGFLLGLLCLWLWPREGGNRLGALLRLGVPSQDR